MKKRIYKSLQIQKLLICYHIYSTLFHILSGSSLGELFNSRNGTQEMRLRNGLMLPYIARRWCLERVRFLHCVYREKFLANLVNSHLQESKITDRWHPSTPSESLQLNKFIFAYKNTKEIHEITKVKNTIRFWLKTLPPKLEHRQIVSHFPPPPSQLSNPRNEQISTCSWYHLSGWWNRFKTSVQSHTHCFISGWLYYMQWWVH